MRAREAKRAVQNAVNKLAIRESETMRVKHRSEIAGLEAFDAGCRLLFAPCMPEPERIVGLGFRYWMLGLNTGDIGAWEKTWDLYCGLFGTTGAKVAVGHLSHWVSALGEAACRDIEVFPERCRSFCRDECVAVSMIAACQHQTCPATRACACALLESDRVDEVVQKAQIFADSLAALDHMLSPASIVMTRVCPPAVHSVMQ